MFFFLYQTDQDGKDFDGIKITTENKSLHQPLNKEVQKLTVERIQETENVKVHDRVNVCYLSLSLFILDLIERS